MYTGNDQGAEVKVLYCSLWSVHHVKKCMAISAQIAIRGIERNSRYIHGSSSSAARASKDRIPFSRSESPGML
jgi:hypothetical protein